MTSAISFTVALKKTAFQKVCSHLPSISEQVVLKSRANGEDVYCCSSAECHPVVLGRKNFEII